MNPFWVIEQLDASGNMQGYLEKAFSVNEAGTVWTTDICKAMQFPTKVMAQAVIDGPLAIANAICGLSNNCVARDHRWMEA